LLFRALTEGDTPGEILETNLDENVLGLIKIEKELIEQDKLDVDKVCFHIFFTVAAKDVLYACWFCCCGILTS